MKNILSVATRIKKPLSLASLVIIVLYLITKHILSLEIFSNINEEKTYLLLTDIFDKIFWLAIIALFLGIVGYILSYYFKNKSSTKKADKKTITKIKNGKNINTGTINAGGGNVHIGDGNQTNS